MRKQGMFAGIVLGIMACLVGAPAHAQDSKISVFAGYSYGTNNFSCTFGFGCFDPGLHGYSAAFAYNLNKHIGLEANFSGHNGNTTVFQQVPSSTSNGQTETVSEDLYTYTFGPRISLPLGNFSLFTHFLVGAEHARATFADTCQLSSGGGTCFNPTFESSRGTGFAFKTGAGLDWNHGRWGIRVLEVDYSHDETSLTGSESCSGCNVGKITSAGSANNFELSTGFTLNFGGMK